MKELIKLNLGCQGRVLEGYVNVDLHPMPNSGIVKADIRSLPFERESASELRAFDVLEHIPNPDVIPTLKHWFDILCPSGIVVIRCPDAKKQAETLLSEMWSVDIYAHMVYGKPGREADFHKTCFTADSLKEKLIKAGFEIVKIEYAHHNMTSGWNSSNPGIILTAKKP